MFQFWLRGSIEEAYTYISRRGQRLKFTTDHCTLEAQSSLLPPISTPPNLRDIVPLPQLGATFVTAWRGESKGSSLKWVNG